MASHSRWLLMYGVSQQVASDVWCLTAGDLLMYGVSQQVASDVLCLMASRKTDEENNHSKLATHLSHKSSI